MTFVVDGTNGLTFNDATTQASTATNASNISSGTLGKARLPTGSVLQVVNSTYATQTTNASTSVYASTGLTASITPLFTTSKILVFVNHNGNVVTGNTSNGGIRIKLQRNGSDLTVIDGMSAYNGNSANNSGGATTSISYLDSPSTTSSTTYSTQFAVRNVGTAYVQYNDGAGLQSVSTITLMEIAG